MKKKSFLMLVLMLMLLSFSLVACGNDSEEGSDKKDRTSRTSREADDEDDEDEEDAEDEEDVEDEKSTKDSEEYSGIVATYEAGEWYYVEATEYAKLRIIDNKTCEYVKRTEYGDNYSEYCFECSYETFEDGFVIEYNDGYDDVSATIYVKGNDILKVADQSSTDADFASIEGKYAFDSEIGNIVFEVDRDGIVNNTIKVDGKKYDSASLFMYDYDGPDSDLFDPEWDLTFSIGDEYYDWYVYFSKNGVTYIPYNEAIYGQFAGTYEMDGQFGPIEIEVDNEGNASLDLTIDGVDYNFNGSISYDYYSDEITFNLYDDNCSMYLIMDTFSDGNMYRGSYTITVELAAG